MKWNAPMSAVAISIALVAALAGCDVVPGAAPTESSSPSDPAPTSKPTNEAPASVIEPVISVAGVDVDGRNVSFSGYVAGVIESGGICVFTAEHDGESVAVRTDAAADRSTTACGLVSEPIASFTKGTWVITLSYSSDANGAVASQPVTLEIP